MKYELKKLISEKLFILLMLLLLATNCILAFRAAPNDKALLKAQNEFLAEYNQNPHIYDKRYDEYLAARELAINNQIDAVLRGEDPDAFIFEEPRTIAPDSGYADIEFYSALYGRKEYGQHYRERLAQIIEETENNLATVTDPYMKDYLLEVKDIYARMSSLPHSQNQISGWESYFAYHGMEILLLFAVTAVSLLLASSDHDKGAQQILYVTAKGFRGVVLQKIGALFVFCLVGVVLFEASSLLVFGTQTSFGGAGEFLASIESYILCPYAVYIYEYALIRIAIRLLVLFSAGLFLLFAARMIPVAFGYPFFCIAFYGANIALDTSKSVIGSLGESLNLFHILNPSNYFLRYASVRLGETSVSLMRASVGLCLGVIVGCTICLLWLWNKAWHRKRLVCKLPAIPSYTPRTSVGFECKKLLIGQKLLLLLIVLLAVKFFACVEMSNQAIPYKEQLYRNYMQTLSGKTNEDIEHFLDQEQAAFLSLFSEAEAKRIQYENGELAYGEYASSTLALRSAEKKYEVFLEVKKEYERIKELNAKGVPAKLVYATGWKKLLFGGPDIATLLVTVVAAFAYTTENKERVRTLFYTTPCGRSKMLSQKLVIFAVITFVSCALFSLLELWSISKAYTLPEWDALVSSVSGIETPSVAFTLRDMLGMLFVKKIALAAILTATAVCLSHATRSSLSAPLIYTAVLFAPHGVALFIGDRVDLLSIPNLFCLSPRFDADRLLLFILLTTSLLLLLLRARKAEK